MLAVLIMCAIQTYFITCMLGNTGGDAQTDKALKGVKATATKK